MTAPEARSDAPGSPDAEAMVETAHQWRKLGRPTFPVKRDGSKTPAVPSWKVYRDRLPTDAELVEWYGGKGWTGMAAPTGRGVDVRGMEMTEVEGRAVAAGALDRVAELAEATGDGELLRKLLGGYVVNSPRGGYNFAYWLDGMEVPGNTKLARDANGDVLAETRGTGGYFIVAPSGGTVHETGRPWTALGGRGPEAMVTITADERERFHALLGTLDEQVPASPAGPSPFAPLSRPGAGNGAISPGDDYAARTSWDEIMTGGGWRRAAQRGEVTYWTRPGKTRGISASTGYGGGDWLFVWSSSTDFIQEKTYTKFGAHAVLHHHGDHQAAAKDLADQGYGQRPERLAVAAAPQTPARGALRVGRRAVRLVKASGIELRAVQWIWEGRLAAGSLALLGGREGIGKSTVAYTLAADLTQGRLAGVHLGHPRAVIVCATEDSWSHTIAPRLIAAGADLELVYRVDVVTSEGAPGGLSLPADLVSLEQQMREVGAVLLLLDPLMSRLEASLDTHKDSEVRQALEPLTALADRSGATVLGLIHVNKSRTNDPLSSLMGSRAFAAVARSVLYVLQDPDDPDLRLLGLAKNNLGRSDLPTQRFRIESQKVADRPEGAVWTGRLRWDGEDSRTLASVLEDSQEHGDVRSATDEAGDWLVGYLADNGGTAPSADIKRDGHKAGHTYDALKRARKKRGLIISNGKVVPRTTFWSLPGTQSEQPSGRSPGESAPTALTALTGDSASSRCSGSSQSGPRESAPTAIPTHPPTLPAGTCDVCGTPLDPFIGEQNPCARCALVAPEPPPMTSPCGHPTTVRDHNGKCALCVAEATNAAVAS